MLALRLLFAGFLSLLPLAQASPAQSMHDDPDTTGVVIRSVSAQAAPDSVGLPARPVPHALTLPEGFAEAIANDTRTAAGRPGPDYWQQEATYTLEARLLPDAKRLEGRGRILYTNNSPNTLRTLHLELAQNLHAEGSERNEAVSVTGGVELRRVALDGAELGAGRAMSDAGGYAVQNTHLVIFPSAPLAPEDSVEIALEWAFDIPPDGASGRMGFNGDSLFFLAYWYPTMAVYDDVVGWYTDPFLGRAEFYHGFGDYDITIEAPPGWLVMSTGAFENPEEVLADDVLERMRRAYESDSTVQIVGPDQFGAEATQPGDENGYLRWRFTAEQVRDVAFSATLGSIWEGARASVGDRDGDGATDYAHINTFYRPSAPRWQRVTEYQQHALAYLSEYTGLPYPYPHMTAVEGGGIIGGGMEFPMMTIMGDYNLRGDSALYYVTAHELAHMWVPMIVSTNERLYSWIDEGFATFTENQARRDYFPGPDPDLGEQQSYLQVARAGAEGEMMRRSNFHYSPTAFVTASYTKPATMLAALRGLLGEETFLEAYRVFLDDWAYQHPYPYDFFNTFERVSGRDLDWFWRSWYYETWTLDQAVASVQPREEGADIVIADKGKVPMPVHLVLTLEGGETVRRTVPVDVWLDGATEATVSVDTPSPITRVEIDPERHFPDLDRRDNVWSRDDQARRGE